MTRAPEGPTPFLVTNVQSSCVQVPTVRAVRKLNRFSRDVLTHVAERFNIPPIMGWGLPNNPRHFDLVSAVAGVILLLSARIVRLFSVSAIPS